MSTTPIPRGRFTWHDLLTSNTAAAQSFYTVVVGATFAAFTPESETPGHDGVPRVGEFSWHELATTDLDAAVAFYKELFGWEDSGEFDMGAAGMYKMFGRQGVPLGGIYVSPSDPPPPPNWLPYVRVPDLSAATSHLTTLGGTILSGPMEVPGGDTVLVAFDPQGAPFAMHQAKGGNS